MYGPFWTHVLPYWNLRHSPNLLFIKYEDMKTNLSGVVRTVAGFLERPLTEEKVQILAKHLSFESMSKNNAVNKEFLSDFTKKFKLAQNCPEGKFLRSGKTGEHKTAMSPEMLKKFEEWIKINIQDTDYVV